MTALLTNTIVSTSAFFMREKCNVSTGYCLAKTTDMLTYVDILRGAQVEEETELPFLWHIK